jgi:methylsterol monooxygenase
VKITSSWLQDCWVYLRNDLLQGDPFLINYVMPNVIVVVSLFIFSTPFMLLDLTGKPAFLYKYKVQRNFRLNIKDVPGLALRSYAMVGVVGPAFYYLIYLANMWRGCPFGEKLPALLEVIWDLLIIALIQTTGFYYGHRAFHYGSLYKRFHKKHHEWKSPVGLTCVYCHPVEHIVCNLLPGVIGPLVCGSHICTMYLWFVIMVEQTVQGHCGYHFPFSQSPQSHDYHHAKFNQCFGPIGFLDWFHGTDSEFRKSKQGQRDRFFFSLTPIHELIPDD